MIADVVWAEYTTLVEVMLPTLSELKAADGSPRWNQAMTAALLNRDGAFRIGSHAISRLVALATSPQAQAQLAALGSAVAAIEVLERGIDAAAAYAAAAAQWSADAIPFRDIVAIAAAQEAAGASAVSQEAAGAAGAVQEAVVPGVAEVVVETAATVPPVDLSALFAIPQPSPVFYNAVDLAPKLPLSWSLRLVPAVTESGRSGGFRFEIFSDDAVLLAAERDGQKGVRMILADTDADGETTVRGLHEAHPEADIAALHPVLAAIQAIPTLVAETVRLGRAVEEVQRRLKDGDVLVDAYFASASEAIAAEETRNGTEPKSAPITRASMDPKVVPAFSRTLSRMIAIVLEGHLAPAPVAPAADPAVEPVAAEKADEKAPEAAK